MVIIFTVKYKFKEILKFMYIFKNEYRFIIFYDSIVESYFVILLI